MGNVSLRPVSPGSDFTLYERGYKVAFYQQTGRAGAIMQFLLAFALIGAGVAWHILDLKRVRQLDTQTAETAKSFSYATPFEVAALRNSAQEMKKAE